MLPLGGFGGFGSLGPALPPVNPKCSDVVGTVIELRGGAGIHLSCYTWLMFL